MIRPLTHITEAVLSSNLSHGFPSGPNKIFYCILGSSVIDQGKDHEIPREISSVLVLIKQNI